MMASAISSYRIIFSLWMAGIFFVAANTELPELDRNLTRHTSEWKPGRTKRFLSDEMPQTLQIIIELESGKRIKLVWKQELQFLANENLPVVVPLADSPINVMNDVGRFVMYYDRVKCSAVVYFEKINAFYGVIGMDYSIANLPFNFDENGIYRSPIVGDPFVKKVMHQFSHIHPMLDPPPPSDVEAWNDFLRPDDELRQNLKRPAGCDAGPSSKVQRTELNGDSRGEIDANGNRLLEPKRNKKEFIQPKYYLEILIFVARDIVELFKQLFEGNHLSWVVRYFIIYFNAVELIFRKFKSVKVALSINIAKIVFEDELTPFEFMSHGELQFAEIIAKLPQHLQNNRPHYPPDSFDHVFIYTSRTIMNGVVQVDGLTKHGEDLYEARKENRFYDVVPITVMKFQNYFNDFARAVYEIGRTLNLKVEPGKKGLESRGQCYGIMQREGPKCYNCLKWSDESEEQFKMFFRENRNRCFLLNTPRSLRISARSRFTTPHRQCQCFGFDTYKPGPGGFPSRRVTKEGCREPLQCFKKSTTQSYESLTVRPFDGTLCTNLKVCWDGKCRRLPISAIDF